MFIFQCVSVCSTPHPACCTPNSLLWQECHLQNANLPSPCCRRDVLSSLFCHHLALVLEALRFSGLSSNFIKCTTITQTSANEDMCLEDAVPGSGWMCKLKGSSFNKLSFPSGLLPTYFEELLPSQNVPYVKLLTHTFVSHAANQLLCWADFYHDG